MTLLSPLAQAIAELLADTAVKAKVADRVRPIEPTGGTNGDVQPPGSWKRFVVAGYLDAPERPGLPVVDAALFIRAYGTSFPDAEALLEDCRAVFRRKGPRVATSRLGVYRSDVTGGGALDKDPDTAQPYGYTVITMIATTAAVPA